MITTPLLSGLGTDQTRLSADTTLGQHIEDVSKVLSGLEEVTLVGHSYAGMTVSGVVEARPAKVQRLIFIDVFIPEGGQCVLDLLPSEIGIQFRKAAQIEGSGWRLPGGEGQGLKPGEARDFVRARLCDFSLRCFEEPVFLSTNRKAAIPATYIVCIAEHSPP